MTDLQKKLEQAIRDMFKLEAQRNEINFALSGVERGEMTLQDYEDDLSVAISNWIVKDILPQELEQQTRAARIDETNKWALHIIKCKNPLELPPELDDLFYKYRVVKTNGERRELEQLFVSYTAAKVQEGREDELNIMEAAAVSETVATFTQRHKADRLAQLRQEVNTVHEK